MDLENLKELVKKIVRSASLLKDKHTDQKDAPVNYACIFSQSEKEYKQLLETAFKMGKVIKETLMGPLFHLPPLMTVAGELRLLKIRKPDKTRPQRGDADFTVENFNLFKKKYLGAKGFKLIEREDFEMVELMDPEFDVRVYFSHPTQEQLLGLIKAKIPQRG